MRITKNMKVGMEVIMNNLELKKVANEVRKGIP